MNERSKYKVSLNNNQSKSNSKHYSGPFINLFTNEDSSNVDSWLYRRVEEIEFSWELIDFCIR